MKARYCPCVSVNLVADIATRSIHLRLSQRRGTMTIRYRVDLSEAERSELQTLLRGGRRAARKLKRAQILLAADAGMPDETIAQSLGVGGSTVYRTKRRFVEGNLDKALHEEPRPGRRSQADRPRGSAAGRDRLLPPARRPGPLDHRTARRRDGSPHRTRERLARDGAPALGRERAQTLAREDVVRAEDRWRVRRPYGGRARSLRRAARSGAPGGVPRRKPRSADRRGARAHPGRAGATRARRLRVLPQWHGEPVRGRGCAPVMAQGERDP